LRVKGEETDYSDIDLNIFKLNEDSGKLEQVVKNENIPKINAQAAVFVSTKKQITLNPGTYILGVKANWQNEQENEVVISFYGDKFIEFEEAGNEVSVEDFLQEKYCSYGRGLDDRWKWNGFFYNQGYYGSSSYVIYCKNNDSDKKYLIEFNFKDVENLRLLEKNKVSDTTAKVVLGPGQETYVVLDRDDVYEGTSCAFGTNAKCAGV